MSRLILTFCLTTCILVLVQSRELRIDSNGNYEITPAERELLEAILKADDQIMRRQARGVVDRVFMTINTISTGAIKVVQTFAQAGSNTANTISAAQAGNVARAPVAAAQPAATVAAAPATTAQQTQSLSFNDQIISGLNRLISYSNSDVPADELAAAMAGRPGGASASSGGGTSSGGGGGNLMGLLGSLGNGSGSGGRNITGIVDEALKIGTPAPVRELVNGILSVAYCSGARRVLGRC